MARIGEEYWKMAESMKEGDEKTFGSEKEANTLRRKIYKLGNKAGLRTENGKFIVFKKGQRKSR